MIFDGEPEPIEGVIFDFHGTLVGGGDVDRWIDAALQQLAATGSAEPKLSAEHLAGLRAYLDQIW